MISRAAAIGLVSLALTLIPLSRAQAQVAREGSGATRAAWDKLELKPFDAANWGKLSDWKNGGPLAEGLTKGKIVLVVTYGDFHPTSKRAMQYCKKLGEQHAADGMIVVGVHSQLGWDEADKPASPDGSFLLAHDAKGEFRAALHGQSDPDYFVIDRAGQMRFAGVASEGVEAAVKDLLGETLEKAGGTVARLDAEKAAKDAEERRSRASRDKVDLATFPDLPFDKPSAEDYEKAAWPRLPRDPNKQDEIVSLEPRDVSLPEGDWYPRKPSLEGKVIVAYFWHPRLRLGSFFQEIDVLQRQRGRDVVYAGVLTVLDNMKIGDQQVNLLKDEKDPEKLHESMLKMAKTRAFDHFLITDAGGKTTYQSIFKDDSETLLPAFAIISTDGKARWWSSKAAVNWEAALNQVVRVDPGVQNRRKAEEKYLKEQKR